jgi:hypothetical protein
VGKKEERMHLGGGLNTKASEGFLSAMYASRRSNNQEFYD